MKIEERFEVASPIDRVYEELTDVGEIGHCIAGVKDVTVLSDTESDWKIEVRAGIMARVLELRGRVVEARSPDYVAFEGSGQDVKLTGHMRLREIDAQRTECEVSVEAEVTGAFAPLVDLMARGPQQQLIRQTIQNVRERLEPSAPGEAPPQAEPSPPGVRSRLWLRARTLWKRVRLAVRRRG